MARELYAEVVTAERLVYAGPVRYVSAPGVLGRLGILPGHAPLLAALRPGELRIQPLHGNGEISLAVSGGFLEVAEGRVMVLARSAERPEEIDIERARRARERALQRLRENGGIDRARALAAKERAEARLAVAAKRGVGSSSGQQL
jgi:F-type H+-transporting ATPase subunit epsilon